MAVRDLRFVSLKSAECAKMFYFSVWRLLFMKVIFLVAVVAAAALNQRA